MGPRYH